MVAPDLNNGPFTLTVLLQLPDGPPPHSRSVCASSSGALRQRKQPSTSPPQKLPPVQTALRKVRSLSAVNV